MLAVLKNKQFWGALVGLALLAYCVKDVRTEELRQLLDRTDYTFLGLAIVSSGLFMFFRALRWRTMILRKLHIPLVRLITLFAAGQVLNMVMPVLTGQVGRMFLFARKLNVRKTFIFSTMVLEVLFDAVSLIVYIFFTSLAFAIPQDYRDLSKILTGAALTLMVLLYLMLHFRLRLEESGRKHLRPRWPGAYIGLKKFMRSFTKGIDLIRSSQHMVSTLSYSLLAWTVHMLVVYFLFRAFGFDHLPVAAAAALMIINTIAMMVPIAPGNAGTFELVVSSSLSAFSVSRSDAVLFAIALHLLDVLPVVVMGLFYFRSENLSIRQLKEEAARKAAHSDKPDNDDVPLVKAQRR